MCDIAPDLIFMYIHVYVISQHSTSFLVHNLFILFDLYSTLPASGLRISNNKPAQQM